MLDRNSKMFPLSSLPDVSFSSKLNIIKYSQLTRSKKDYILY